jgi:N-acetyl-anhydromuramyl-L-alanine amidase AmpD
MKSRDVWHALPAEPGPERERAIWELVRQGQGLQPEFVTLPVAVGRLRGVVYVAQDALSLGEPADSIRVNVTAETAQWICDLQGWMLPTTKVCDLLWQQARVRLSPCLQPATRQQRLERGYSPSMADTAAMVRHSQEIDKKREGRRGLICNVGKHWVLSKALGSKPGRAANYGYYDGSAPYVSASGLRMWQTLSTAHNLHHVDYSQVLQPLRAEMLVEGQVRSVADVLLDHELAPLVSDEGPLSIVRLPGVRRSPADCIGEPPPVWLTRAFGPTERLRISGVLRRGSTGVQVAQWQRFIRVYADGVFGPRTETATRAWQAAHPPLQADGIVGPATLAQAELVQQQRQDAGSSAEDDLISDFRQARNYRACPGGRQIKWIVMHSAELDEVVTGAEALAAWAAGPQAPRASWHYAVDSDSIVQSVLDRDIAWHAPGANKQGLGIELVGRARQTAAEWTDDFSTAELHLAAKLVSRLCLKHGLPLSYVDREGLKRGEPGVTTHREVSFAFHKSDHVDPGPNFPMHRLLEWARAERGRQSGPAA